MLPFGDFNHILGTPRESDMLHFGWRGGGYALTDLQRTRCTHSKKKKKPDRLIFNNDNLIITFDSFYIAV